MIEAVVPRVSHLVRIAETMRPADRAEIAALGLHPDPLDALRTSVAVSQHCAVFVADGTPLCAFGVAPLSLVTGAGSPWLLGSVAMMQHIRNLVPLAAPYIAEMRRLYPHLENHVHADNRAAVRWLRVAGFTLEPATPYGLHGALFHRFTMKA